MRTLITGSSGFIGSYLVAALRRAGDQVVGVDRKEPDWSKPDTFIHGDMLAEGVLERALQGVQRVVHLAASKDDWGISRQEYFRDNVEATRRLVELGRERGIEQWFHYSTVGVLPPGSEPSSERDNYGPTTDYGASKAEAERSFFALEEQDPSAEIILLRPSAVYGPRHPPSTNIHRLIEALRTGKFVMVGDGETLKTTSYIENLVEVTFLLMENMSPGVQVYHYVDYPVMTTGQIVNSICRNVSNAAPRWHLPQSFARRLASVSDAAGALLGVNFPITAARIEKFCTSTNYSASAIRDLGYSQSVSNDEALSKTVRWHQDREGRGGG